MKKTLKYFTHVFLVFGGILLFAAVAHFFVFPQESHCILVGYSDFRKENGVYYKEGTPDSTKKRLDSLIPLAKNKVQRFWESPLLAKPTFIYCHEKSNFEKYGGNPLAPASTHMKMGSYVIINSEGLDLQIIAHEICHAELYTRVGFFKNLSIPMWFHEGLAMQVDERNCYSLDSLIAKTDSLRILPDVKKLNSGNDFQNGDVLMNYRAAKYEVAKWYSKDKLRELLACFANGNDFMKCYEKGVK